MSVADMVILVVSLEDGVSEGWGNEREGEGGREGVLNLIQSYRKTLHAHTSQLVISPWVTDNTHSADSIRITYARPRTWS